MRSWTKRHLNGAIDLFIGDRGEAIIFSEDEGLLVPTPWSTFEFGELFRNAGYKGCAKGLWRKQ